MGQTQRLGHHMGAGEYLPLGHQEPGTNNCSTCGKDAHNRYCELIGHTGPFELASVGQCRLTFPEQPGLLLPLYVEIAKANAPSAEKIGPQYRILSPPILAIGYNESNDGKVLVNTYDIIVPHNESNVNAWKGHSVLAPPV